MLINIFRWWRLSSIYLLSRSLQLYLRQRLRQTHLSLIPRILWIRHILLIAYFSLPPGFKSSQPCWHHPYLMRSSLKHIHLHLLIDQPRINPLRDSRSSPLLLLIGVDSHLTDNVTEVSVSCLSGRLALLPVVIKHPLSHLLHQNLIVLVGRQAEVSEHRSVIREDGFLSLIRDLVEVLLLLHPQDSIAVGGSSLLL